MLLKAELSDDQSQTLGKYLEIGFIDKFQTPERKLGTAVSFPSSVKKR